MHDPRTEELFTIKDDVAPDGSGLQGMSAGVDLTRTALGHPSVRWQDRVTEMDVYATGDVLMVHFYCPKCQQGLRVTSQQKRIRYDRSENRIDIEAMRCTWPGCGWHVAIEGNRALDQH